MKLHYKHLGVLVHLTFRYSFRVINSLDIWKYVYARLQLVNERWKFLTIQLVDTYKKPLERHLAYSAQVYS